LAAEAGCAELVSSFLDLGAPLHARDDAGLQLIHYATIAGSPELVSVLLKAGASAVAVYGPQQRQLIVDAIQKNFYEIMDLLLDARASVHHSQDGLQLII